MGRHSIPDPDDRPAKSSTRIRRPSVSARSGRPNDPTTVPAIGEPATAAGSRPTTAGTTIPNPVIARPDYGSPTTTNPDYDEPGTTTPTTTTEYEADYDDAGLRPNRTTAGLDAATATTRTSDSDAAASPPPPPRALGPAAQRRLGGRRVDRQPPRGDRRQARRQPRRHRRARHRRRGGRRRHPVALLRRRAVQPQRRGRRPLRGRRSRRRGRRRPVHRRSAPDAGRHTTTRPPHPVGDRCVKVGVKPADSDQVVNGFIGKWPAELGERPALWIPGQLGVRGAARGGGRRADRQRQPIPGHLTRGAGHPPAAQRRAGPTELGNAAGAADATRRRWTG